MLQDPQVDSKPAITRKTSCVGRQVIVHALGVDNRDPVYAPEGLSILRDAETTPSNFLEEYLQEISVLEGESQRLGLRRQRTPAHPSDPMAAPGQR